jgi:hypothetical protein
MNEIPGFVILLQYLGCAYKNFSQQAEYHYLWSNNQTIIIVWQIKFCSKSYLGKHASENLLQTKWFFSCQIHNDVMLLY